MAGSGAGCGARQVIIPLTPSDECHAMKVMIRNEQVEIFNEKL